MANLDLVALRPPVRGEQIGDETTVTFFRARLGTEQSGSRRPWICIKRLRDSPFLHQSQKTSLINSPVLAFAIGVEQPRSWREPRLMGIADAGNFLQEIGKVRMLGEAGELTTAVETDIDELLYVRFLEQAEELFGSLSRKSDRA